MLDILQLGDSLWCNKVAYIDGVPTAWTVWSLVVLFQLERVSLVIRIRGGWGVTLCTIGVLACDVFC
jgi:hypothetical protein